jgi:hypothetical protein
MFLYYLSGLQGVEFYLKVLRLAGEKLFQILNWGFIDNKYKPKEYSGVKQNF